MRQAINVARIRGMTGRTQDSFARMLGISAATLRNWEHGRRRPTGAARVLLRLVEADPVAVTGLLQRARERESGPAVQLSGIRIPVCR